MKRKRNQKLQKEVKGEILRSLVVDKLCENGGLNDRVGYAKSFQLRVMRQPYRDKNNASRIQPKVRI